LVRSEPLVRVGDDGGDGAMHPGPTEPGPEPAVGVEVRTFDRELARTFETAICGRAPADALLRSLTDGWRRNGQHEKEQLQPRASRVLLAAEARTSHAL
jgi:hypothetical protein